MQNARTEALKIAKTEANTFQYFGLVVAAFSKAVRIWNVQCVQNFSRPVVVSIDTGLEFGKRIVSAKCGFARCGRSSACRIYTYPTRLWANNRVS